MALDDPLDRPGSEVVMAPQEVSQLSGLPKLLGKEQVAEGTTAFHFEKPPGFDFKPGQSADVTLFNPPETDVEGNTRTFSVASAPFEDKLTFATRMRDTAFKRSLTRMPPGTGVKIDSALGSFTLHKNSAKPGVFLAGGIGITPFLSILRQADHDRAPHKVILFYCNHRPEDAAFLEALQRLATSNANFRFVGTMTKMANAKKKWDGETGRINKEMLSRYMSDLHGPIYYIAGPPAMVTGIREMLVAARIDEDDIRTEEFPGY